MSNFFTQALNEYSKTIKGSLMYTAHNLVKNAKSIFVQSVPKAGVKGKFKDTLTDAVRYFYNRRNSTGEYTEVTVHTMGTRETGSGTFRARFFEQGTVDRDQGVRVGRKGKTYKTANAGHPTGRINPVGYFQQAVNNANTQWQEDLERFIDRATDKLNHE